MFNSDLQAWAKILPPNVWNNIWQRAHEKYDGQYAKLRAYILAECESYAELYGISLPEPDLSEPKPAPVLESQKAAELLQGELATNNA